MAAIAPSVMTSAKMKKIFPMVVKPVKRCGVPARSKAIPAVERGKANHAQVKLEGAFSPQLTSERGGSYSLVDSLEKRDMVPLITK